MPIPIIMTVLSTDTMTILSMFSLYVYDNFVSLTGFSHADHDRITGWRSAFKVFSTSVKAVVNLNRTCCFLACSQCCGGCTLSLSQRPYLVGDR